MIGNTFLQDSSNRKIVLCRCLSVLTLDFGLWTFEWVMGLKVLIIPDKFKGTLTAQQAAEAIARGWRTTRPEDSLELLPMSDGGDGFGEIISGILQARVQPVKTVNAAHHPCEAVWWWHEETRTAIIESARVVGLAQLPPKKYHPFELDTEGLGPVLEAAARQGAERCVLGVGGSATNDGGFGLARALGWQFFNVHDERIARWTELHTLAQVRPPESPQLFKELIVAVDVQNPLLGPGGCTRIYGPQKGLRPGDFDFAERCLEQMAQILEKELHLDYAREPGTGAAGGLGFGLRCFVGARLEAGFNLFARYANLPERLRSVQLVLSGEGAIDDSSLMGKGVGELAKLCQALDVPCLGLAGVASQSEKANRTFSQTFGMTPQFASHEEAVTAPALWLERLSAKVAKEWPAS